MNKPKIPKPIPPANPAQSPYASQAGGSAFGNYLATLPGIYTSTAGITTPAPTQKRTLFGA